MSGASGAAKRIIVTSQRPKLAALEKVPSPVLSNILSFLPLASHVVAQRTAKWMRSAGLTPCGMPVPPQSLLSAYNTLTPVRRNAGVECKWITAIARYRPRSLQLNVISKPTNTTHVPNTLKLLRSLTNLELGYVPRMDEFTAALRALPLLTRVGFTVPKTEGENYLRFACATIVRACPALRTLALDLSQKGELLSSTNAIALRALLPTGLTALEVKLGSPKERDHIGEGLLALDGLLTVLQCETSAEWLVGREEQNVLQSALRVLRVDTWDKNSRPPWQWAPQLERIEIGSTWLPFVKALLKRDGLSVVVHRLRVPRWTSEVAHVMGQLERLPHCLDVGDWESCGVLWRDVNTAKLRLKRVTVRRLTDPDTDYLTVRDHHAQYLITLDAVDGRWARCGGCLRKVRKHWLHLCPLHIESDCQVKVTLALTTLPAVMLRGTSFCEYTWITDKGKTSWARSNGNLELIRERIDQTCCRSCCQARGIAASTPN